MEILTRRSSLICVMKRFDPVAFIRVKKPSASVFVYESFTQTHLYGLLVDQYCVGSFFLEREELLLLFIVQ